MLYVRVVNKMSSPLTCLTKFFFHILISAMDDQDRKNAEEYKRHGKDKQPLKRQSRLQRTTNVATFS